MLGNTWNITFRNLIKHKTFVFINVFGLAVAIASSVIILLYAKNELTYDAFHENSERINLVIKERNTAQGIRELDDTWTPLLGVMQAQFPTIVSGVRVFERTQWVESNNQKYQEEVTFADPSLFEIFSFPLAEGDSKTALDGVNSMVLSRETAEKYFGSENPIGKRITVNFNQDFLVTGVLEDIPQNSSIRPTVIVSFESAIAPDDEQANSNWGSSFLNTYLLLDKTAEATGLEAQFPTMVQTLFGEDGPNGSNNMKFRLWPLESLHDRAEGSEATSYALLVIAFSIILIACVNFMNLATARSMERAREVGVRKTLGALRWQLVRQFLSESMLISTIALGLGIVIADILLPVFNSLYGLDLSLSFIDDFAIFSLLLLVGLVAGFLSGGYPAFFLSGFKTVESLKGRLQSSRHGVRLRNGLSVVQFSFAITLIIAVVVIWQQVQHMKNSELNFDAEQVLVLRASLGDFEDAQIGASRIETFKNNVLQLPGVVSVASSMSVPGSYEQNNTFATPENWQTDEPLRMLISVNDDNYFETFGMNFIEGRNFSRDFSTENDAIILNETAMRDMGWDSAVGKKVNNRWTVVGVVEDFHYQSLENEIAAIIHLYRPEDSGAQSFISIKLDSADTPSLLTALEEHWRNLDPTRPFDYYFVEDSFNDLYQDMDNISAIIGYFSLLSIIIANLGLLGLSSYSVIQRTKEIGIRKVLGASVADILVLLSKQFAKPVLIANLIAWPLAYVGISQWLQSFPYRIDVSWIIFLLAGLFVFALAVVTISAQSAKVANSNPVKSLRYE